MTLQELVATTGVQPREYQERLVTKTCGYYESGIKSVLVNSPTGSGKTIVGLLAARYLQLQHDIGIGWVAMRRNLLKQAAAANQNMRIGCEGIRFMSMFDHNPPTTDELGRPIKLLVVDECQHDSVSSMSNLHNIIRPKWILGMTATPYRTDRVKLSFDKVIRDIGIHQLIQSGYLSQYHQFTLPRWDVDEIVSCYLREPERWGKSAIYFLSREDATACCNRLQASGIKAETVFGDQPMAEREEKLERFESGDLQVLVNMVLLTEGWDSPSLRTVFVRDSQRGPTIQMCLDSSTEILTDNGWKKHSEISRQDQSAAFDQATGAIKFVPIQEIVKRPVAADELFCRIKNPHLDIRVTDLHDLVYRSRSKQHRHWLKTTALELSRKSTPFQLPIAGLKDNLGVDLTNVELQFIGLFLTDGCWCRNAVSISQSAASDQVPVIEELIEHCGYNCSKSTTKRKGRLAKYPPCSRWNIAGKQIDRIRPFLRDGKRECLVHLGQLTQQQLSQLLLGMQIGDGKKHRCVDYTPRTYTLCLGNDYEFIDDFQALCICKGFRCNLSYYQYPPNEWNKLGEHGAVVYVKKLSYSSVCGSKVSKNERNKRCQIVFEPAIPNELVWCIRNGLGTIITRRNGKVAIVGNCGRVFRKYPGIEFKQVVQSKMTHWPIQRTASPALACVWLPEEREWRSYAQSEAIEKVSMRVCMALAHIQTSMPAYIAKKMEKKLRRQRRHQDGDERANTESGLPRRDDSGLDVGARVGWVGGLGGGAIIH